MHARLRYLWLILGLVALLPALTRAEVAVIHTFWPLYDYRADPVTGQQRLSLLGPLLRWSVADQREDWALRPLAYRIDRDGERQRDELDILYPLYSRRQEGDDGRTSLLQLYRSSDGAAGEWSLFPLLFSTRSAEGEADFAFFPLGGTIHRHFGRDRIDFTLFPLYGRTERGGVTTTNLLWPFFATMDGEGVTGVKLWPLYGQSEKAGVYRRQMLLWPFFYRNHERLNTDNPTHRRGLFPLLMLEESPELTLTHWLWPFFSLREDRAKGYQETWAPWPLLRFLDGEGYYARRVLPFYSDERSPEGRDRWWLWPLYKREEERWEGHYRRRDRLLYFLFSDLEEGRGGEDEAELRRVALWPLFTWERKRGVERFHALSLLEPFLPDNGPIERLWSPYWRLYQSLSLPDGRQARSLLWNLYWQESQGDDTALELFPLLWYRRQESAGLREWKLLKGLVGHRREAQAHTLYLFFLPIPLGSGETDL